MVRHFQVLHFQSTRSEEVATAVTAVSLPVNAMKFRAADLFPRVNKLINDNWQKTWKQLYRKQIAGY